MHRLLPIIGVVLYFYRGKLFFDVQTGEIKYPHPVEEWGRVS